MVCLGMMNKSASEVWDKESSDVVKTPDLTFYGSQNHSICGHSTCEAKIAKL